VAAAVVALVEGGCVLAVEEFHAGGELGDGCFDDQVVVIVHQAEGVHGPAVDADAEGEQGEKGEPVDVVAEDRAAVDAAGGDVEEAVRERRAKDARHRPRP
jgi:hypothetical protein